VAAGQTSRGLRWRTPASSRPSVAWIYNYPLRGKDNFVSDRVAAEEGGLCRQRPAGTGPCAGTARVHAGRQMHLHPPDEEPSPAQVIATLEGPLVPGSYVAVTHGSGEYFTPENSGALSSTFQQTRLPIAQRDSTRSARRFIEWPGRGVTVMLVSL
jgi:hypothetical protein